jgi:hypothetical protein
MSKKNNHLSEFPCIRVRKGDVLVISAPGPIPKAATKRLVRTAQKAFKRAGVHVPPVLVAGDGLHFSVISRAATK